MHRNDGTLTIAIETAQLHGARQHVTITGLRQQIAQLQRENARLLGVIDDMERQHAEGDSGFTTLMESVAIWGTGK